MTSRRQGPRPQADINPESESLGVMNPRLGYDDSDPSGVHRDRAVSIMASGYADVTPLGQRCSAAYESKQDTRSEKWDQRFLQPALPK